MDLLDPNVRKQLIDEIKGNENAQRRAESLKQVEIFNDRLDQYVNERLREDYEEQTVKEMPVISSINLSRRIVKQEASVYKKAPDRMFSELTEQQNEIVEMIYDDMNFDSKMKKSNESFKLQNQNHVMIVLKDGKIVSRVLRNHHIDSIPDPKDPESAIGYIISSFDKSLYLEDYSDRNIPTGFRGDSERTFTDESNKNNEKIGDPDDYKSTLERYVVWTKEYNFIMDGKANILTPEDELINEIGIVPIVEVSIEKDFEYWVRQGVSTTEFTIDYNVLLSDIAQVVKMQGWAQAVFIGNEDIIRSDIKIGPNKILKLPISSDGERPSFDFVNPSPDLAGSISFLELTLANFLTSRGVDPEIISGNLQGSTSQSGIQELLKMVKQFSASKDDFAIYEHVEDKVYEIIKAWVAVYSGTDLLDQKYWAGTISEDSKVSVKYHEPQMIETRAEKVSTWQNEIEMGLANRAMAFADINNVSIDDAKEMIAEIDADELGIPRGEPVADQ